MLDRSSLSGFCTLHGHRGLAIADYNKIRDGLSIRSAEAISQAYVYAMLALLASIFKVRVCRDALARAE